MVRPSSRKTVSQSPANATGPVPAATGRTERLNARITPVDQALLTKVATLQGVSVSTFVIQAARARAKLLLRRRRLIRLSVRDQNALLSALLSTPAANAALVRAKASHADEVLRRADSPTRR